MPSRKPLKGDEINFDALSEADLNALPFGVIKLTAIGDVLFYSDGESKISGRRSDRCVGRNFFEDLAPCSNAPGFFGRLANLARAGCGRDSFEFFFTFYFPRLRAQIELSVSSTPGEYWMAVRPIEVLTEYRDLEALRVVEAAVQRSAGDGRDLSVCDRENIHTPDAIQSHGALIVMDLALERITAISRNLDDYLGDGASDALGASAQRIFQQAFLDDLSIALPLANSSHSGVIALGREERSFDYLAHRGEEAVLVEIEPIGESAQSDPFNVSKFLSLLTSRIDMAFGRDHVAQMVVREIRAFTEFDRVMVYRFDATGDGDVIAEAKAADWEQSFMGLRFPASDIPMQARRLYRRSRLRHLPDNDYVASPLDMAEKGAAPIDLSLAWLRSIAPVHREYHRNMGVAATFSASIMAGGELWGLIIGHHRTAKRLGFRIRQAIGFAADLVGPHLIQEETVEQMGLRTEHEQVHRRLLEELSRTDELLMTLISGPVSLADLFLDSYGAVCRMGGRIYLIGHTPDESVVEQLIEWLRDELTDDVWASDCVSAHAPELAQHREVVSGLLAISLDRDREDMIIWFRPEVARMIAWAGDPRGKIEQDGMILPRKGFEQWVEQTTGHSRPWPAWKLDLARRLRNAIMEVIAAQSTRLQRINGQLADANESKRRMLAGLSHDFRTMLTDVIGFTEVIKNGMAGPITPRQADYLGDVAKTSAAMLTMIDTVVTAAARETPAPRPGEFVSEPAPASPDHDNG